MSTDTRPLVYVAHPMAGKTHDEIRAIEYDGTAWANEHGFMPVLPRLITGWCSQLDQHGLARKHCQPDGTGSQDDEHTYACYMRGDIAALLLCDVILMMPGWEKSKGATAEHTVARTVGIPRHYYLRWYEDECLRVDGDVPCPVCSNEWRKHEQVVKAECPTLVRGCDGRLRKL